MGKGAIGSPEAGNIRERIKTLYLSSLGKLLPELQQLDDSLQCRVCLASR